MKKRFATIAVAAVMTATSAFAFIGCGGDDAPSAPPDTFYTGTLSVDSYNSVSLAAQAFLSNEVCGDATAAKFESYEKQADMTEEEIAELNLTDAEKAAVVSAEKGFVNYTESAVAAYNVYSSATENVKKIKVYVVKIGNEYRYYAPALVAGDVLTKAYYDQVFDPSKYINCTMVYDMTVVTTASAQGMSVSMTMKTNSTFKCTADSAHIVIVSSASMLNHTETETTELYVEFASNNGFNGDYTLYMKEDGGAEWVESYMDLSEVGSVGEIENDYSYFIKTNSGFKLNSEKFDLYLQDAIDDLNGVAGLNMGSLKATAEYNVYDGKLSTATAVVSANFSADGANGNVKATTSAKYSDFGTTVVSVQI